MKANITESVSGGSDGKESACNAGDLNLIPGSGRSPGEGKGYPLQYSSLENLGPCIVHRVTESDTTEQFQSFRMVIYFFLITDS